MVLTALNRKKRALTAFSGKNSKVNGVVPENSGVKGFASVK